MDGGEAFVAGGVRADGPDEELERAAERLVGVDLPQRRGGAAVADGAGRPAIAVQLQPAGDEEPAAGPQGDAHRQGHHHGVEGGGDDDDDGAESAGDQPVPEGVVGEVRQLVRDDGVALVLGEPIQDAVEQDHGGRDDAGDHGVAGLQRITRADEAGHRRGQAHAGGDLLDAAQHGGVGEQGRRLAHADPRHGAQVGVVAEDVDDEDPQRDEDHGRLVEGEVPAQQRLAPAEGAPPVVRVEVPQQQGGGEDGDHLQARQRQRDEEQTQPAAACVAPLPAPHEEERGQHHHEEDRGGQAATGRRVEPIGDFREHPPPQRIRVGWVAQPLVPLPVEALHEFAADLLQLGTVGLLPVGLSQFLPGLGTEGQGLGAVEAGKWGRRVQQGEGGGEGGVRQRGGERASQGGDPADVAVAFRVEQGGHFIDDGLGVSLLLQKEVGAEVDGLIAVDSDDVGTRLHLAEGGVVEDRGEFVDGAGGIVLHELGGC